MPPSSSPLNPEHPAAAVAPLPSRQQRPDVVVLENELREALRSARKDLTELLAYVVAQRPLEPARREGLYELRIAIQQKLQAVRWRLAEDLAGVDAGARPTPDTLQRLATATRELAEECHAIEQEATKAWSHILSIFATVPPLP